MNKQVFLPLPCGYLLCLLPAMCWISSAQFSHSVVSDSATPWIAARQASPVHHQLPESTQTHVHWVGDAIQPSHPLSSPSPPALKLSQHQGLFKWVSSLRQVAKVLEFQLQHVLNGGSLKKMCIPALFLYLFIYCTVWHVGSYFPDNGLNLFPLHWKAES